MLRWLNHLLSVRFLTRYNSQLLIFIEEPVKIIRVQVADLLLMAILVEKESDTGFIDWGSYHY